MSDLSSKRINKFIVTVNRHKIAANRKKFGWDNLDPPIRISAGKRGAVEYRSNAEFDCHKVRVIYDPLNPLPCGATVWIEIE